MPIFNFIEGDIKSQARPIKYIEDLKKDFQHVLCFLNGNFMPEQSLMNASAEVSVKPRFLDQISRGQNELNSLGAEVEIMANTTLTKLAILHFYSDESISSIKNLYNFEKASSAEVLEAHFVINQSSESFNSISKCILAEEARVDFVQIIRSDVGVNFINNCDIKVNALGKVNFFNFTEGGKKTTNFLEIILNGRSASADLNTLSILKNKSIIENNSYVHHRYEGTKSDQLVKTVVDDLSKASFLGKLEIDQVAQKSDARQYNSNLLLSDDAEVESRPQLEVHADDVKAGHGSTVGQINEDEMFYLQSRGISLLESKEILARAYQNDVVLKINSDFLRGKLNDFLNEREMS
ncbi:MAG: SufD family Fe-S cluster assembly protein [Bdellovibrionales bacterium]